ncbi:MAG: hypothetical protein QXK89_10590 [Candidatus Bathyarchaeia archaeon]
MELNSKEVKEYALKCGADLVGIASIDRFEGAPLDMHPATIFPEAKSVIVIAIRILRGSLRGIEEGTSWDSYNFFGYNLGLGENLSFVERQTARFIEKHGWEAVPVMAKAALSEWGPTRDPVAPGKPPSDCVPSFRFAAVAAGLGEIGYSKLLLTPEFGPRQRLAMILTDAPLEPDPIFNGKICDRCMCCVKECPAGAISAEETIRIVVAGKTLEWGKLDTGKCKLTHFGFNRKSSPFIIKDLPGLRLDISKQTMTWKEAHDFGWSLARMVRYFSILGYGYKVYWATCARCIRACVEHLEERGILKNKFFNTFRRRKPWLLNHKI